MCIIATPAEFDFERLLGAGRIPLHARSHYFALGSTRSLGACRANTNLSPFSAVPPDARFLVDA
jgi:hypothetical protein